MRVPAVYEFLVYLEGVRIAFNDVTISAQANKPATASISVVPVKAVRDILPRTLVHIFYKDIALTNSTKEQDQFRLIFEGEAVGVGFSKDASGARRATISCMDLSNYFFYTYGFYYPELSRGKLGVLQSILIGDETLGQKRADSIGTSKPDSGPVSADTKTGSGYITRLLSKFNENGVVAAFQEIFRLSQENNEFFRLANRRLRLTDSIDPPPVRGEFPDADSVTGQPFLGTEAPRGLGNRGKVLTIKDPESVTLFAANPLNPEEGIMEGTFKYLVGQFPSYFKITQIMEKLMNLFYYQYWPIPNSSAVVEKTKQGFRINSFIIKPTTFYTAPPACNVLFPELYGSVSFSRNFLEEPTRLILRTPPGVFASQEIQYNFLAPPQLQLVINKFFNKLRDTPRTDPERVENFTPDLTDVPGLLFNKDDIRLTDTPIGTLYRTLMAFENQPIESREDIKGIIDREIMLPINAFAGSLLKIRIDPKAKKQKRGPAEGFSQYLTAVADFELFKAQHENRIVTVSGPFNPYFTPGFPFAVLDTENPVIAEAGSVTWSFSADGSGSTVIHGTYARDRDVIKTVEFPDATPLITSDIKLTITDFPFNLIDAPFWTNFSYRPEIVGSNKIIDVKSHKISTDDKKMEKHAGETRQVLGAYPQIFGSHKSGNNSIPHKSLLQTLNGEPPESYKFLQFEAIRLALEENQKIENELDRANAAWNFVRRNVASLDEVFSYINAKVTSIERIENISADAGPFRKEHRAAAQAVRDAAPPGRVGTVVGGTIGQGILAT